MKANYKGGIPFIFLDTPPAGNCKQCRYHRNCGDEKNERKRSHCRKYRPRTK